MLKEVLQAVEIRRNREANHIDVVLRVIFVMKDFFSTVLGVVFMLRLFIKNDHPVKQVMLIANLRDYFRDEKGIRIGHFRLLGQQVTNN